MGRITMSLLTLTLVATSMPVILCGTSAQPLTDQDSLPISHAAGDAALRSTRIQLALDSDNMGVFTDEHPGAIKATVYKFTDHHDLTGGVNGEENNGLQASVNISENLNELILGDDDKMHNSVHESNGSYDHADHIILPEIEPAEFHNYSKIQPSVHELPDVNDIIEDKTMQDNIAENLEKTQVAVNKFPNTNVFAGDSGKTNNAGTVHKLERANPQFTNTDHLFNNEGSKLSKMMAEAEGENSITSESEEKEKFLVELARRILDVRKQGFSKTSFIIHPNNSPLPTYHPLPDNLERYGSENNLRKVDSGDKENSFDISPDNFINVTQFDTERVLSANSNSEVPLENSPMNNMESTEFPSTEGFSSSAMRISPYTSLYEKLQPSPEDEPLVSSLVSQLKEILNSTETIGNTETEPPSSTAYYSLFSESETTTNPEEYDMDIESTVPPKTSKNASENVELMEGEVTDFLQSVASSSGFQGAFVGELIKSFNSLNHNAMSLLYNLLIGPLKLAPTMMNEIANKKEEDHFSLSRNFTKGTFEPSERVSNSVNSEGLSSEDMWLPFKSRARTSRNGYDIEVITAPPREKFELVVGSSLSSEPRNAALFQRRSGLPDVGNFQMGMSMPPPEALGALPPGAQIILPSQMRRQPVLPKITINGDNIPVPVIEARPPRRQEPQANHLGVFSSLPNFFSSLFSSPTEQPHRANKRPGPSRRRRLPGHPYHGVKNRPNVNRQRPGRKQLARDKFDRPLNLQPPGIPLVHKMVHSRPPVNGNPNLLQSPTNSHHRFESSPFPPPSASPEAPRRTEDAHHQFGSPQDKSHFDQFVPSPEYKPHDRVTLSENHTPQMSAENAIGFFPKPRAEGGFVPLSRSKEVRLRRPELDQFSISSHFAVRHEMRNEQGINKRTFTVHDPYADGEHVSNENENIHYSLGSKQDFEPIYRVSDPPDRNHNRIVPQKVTFEPTRISDHNVHSHDNDDELKYNSSPMYQPASNPSHENKQKADQQPTKLTDPAEDSAYSTAEKSGLQNNDRYSNSHRDNSYDSITSEHRFDHEHLLPSSPHPEPLPTQGIVRKPIEYYEEVHHPEVNISGTPLDHSENSKYASIDRSHYHRNFFEASKNDNSNYNRPASDIPENDRNYHGTNSNANAQYDTPAAKIPHHESSNLEVVNFSDTKRDKPAEETATYDSNFYEYYEHNPDEFLYPDFTSKRIKSEPSVNERMTPLENYDDGVTHADLSGYEYDNIPQASFSHINVVSTEPAEKKEMDEYPPEYYEYVYYDDASDQTQDRQSGKDTITFGSFNSSFGDYETDGFVVNDVVPMVGTVRPINQSTMFNHNMAKSQEEDAASDFPSLESPIKPVDALNNIQLSQMFEDDIQSLHIPVSDIDLSRAPEPKIKHHRPVEEDPDSSAAYLFNTIDLVPQSADLFNTRHIVDQNVKENPILHNSTSKFNFTYSETTNIVEEVPAQEYMAYVLIGSCIGLSLLSISGVLLIVKFKKSCGSRQIRSRQRLKKSSLPDVSHAQETFLESDPGGHKLGSWFTGKGGTFGSSKLRSNMALPSVEDLRRDQPERSSSRRDLLSSASDTSEGTDRERPQDDPIVNRSKNNSWSSKEKEASQNDACQSSPMLEVVAESPKRQSFERNSRDNQRSDHECKHQRPHSSQSSELQKKHLPEPYTTDSEFYDPTSADEGRSSCFMDTSHDFDTISNIRGRKSVTTSQELGEKLSRDIRNFHERASPMTSRDSTVDRGRPNPEGESNLRRTTSEVSFTRDNVQNEVFLEFDNIFKQHGQYLTASDGHQSSLDRVSDAGGAGDKRSNSPDSIENPKTPSDRRSPGSSDAISKHSRSSDGSKHHRSKSTSVSSGKLPRKSSPPTPPRFTPPPPPPRPPKPERLSKSFGQESPDSSHLPPKSDRLV